MLNKFIIGLIVTLSFELFYTNPAMGFTLNDNLPKANDSIAPAKEKKKPVVLEYYHKNVIKFNPTPMWMWEQPENVTFSYERLLKNNNSISLLLGYLVFPQILDDTLFNTIQITDYSSSGINVALDFRHYPGARNTRPAPDGFYLGAYLSYNGTSFNNTFAPLNGQVQVTQPGSFKGTFGMTNLGCEIGYQFIFWKRFSVDLLMFGPAITYYMQTLELTGITNDNLINNIDEELAAKLSERFPAIGFLYKGDNKKVTSANMVLSTSFRYSVQLGYHF